MGRLPPNPREACLRREAGRSQTILYGRIRPISGELPKGTSKLLPLPQDNRRLTAGIVFSGNRTEHAFRHTRGKAPLGGAPTMAVACASGRCPTGTMEGSAASLCTCTYERAWDETYGRRRPACSITGRTSLIQ